MDVIYFNSLHFGWIMSDGGLWIFTGASPIWQQFAVELSLVTQLPYLQQLCL